MKDKNFIRTLCLALLAAALVACSDWTKIEPIEQKIDRPKDQDPELWAKYTAALRDYKQSEHFITYAVLLNSPQPAESEKDFMRCLPDSLDIVSLANADNFSKYDLEDIPAMKEKGTRILYQVDYEGRAEELSDQTALGAYLDKAIEVVRNFGLDGYSFTGIPQADNPAANQAAALIVEKLSAAKSAGQLLVFEGNPLFVQAADRQKVDYFVLDTERTESITQLKMQVLNATGYAAVPPEKLLLSASADAKLYDEERVEFASITETANRVVSLGPMAGIAFYNIGGDYYDAEMNYRLIRQAIQTLNPSK